TRAAPTSDLTIGGRGADMIDLTVRDLRRSHRGVATAWVLLVGVLACADTRAGSGIDGHVFDLNGHPLHQATVTFTKTPVQSGPSTVTVFTEESVHFHLPGGSGHVTVSAQLLGYRPLDSASHVSADASDLRIILRADANQAGVAPASAWLGRAATPKD